MKRIFFKTRGFLLVFALLLTVLISLIALGLLGIKKSGYSSSRAAVNAIQARSLARSGMGDIWVKMSKDPFYPGGLGDEQTRFSFREEVKNRAGEVVGSYTVTLDRTYRYSHQVTLIECTGVAGALEDDSAHHTIYGELSTGQLPPPDPVVDGYGFKVWEEGVSPKL